MLTELAHKDVLQVLLLLSREPLTIVSLHTHTHERKSTSHSIIVKGNNYISLPVQLPVEARGECLDRIEDKMPQRLPALSKVFTLTAVYTELEYVQSTGTAIRSQTARLSASVMRRTFPPFMI